jgi:heptosyltransferase III
MVKLSVIIITYNEEKNIGRCIDSVKSIADEIVVVDSFSKDNTKKICLEKGARFIQHPFEGHIQQKNFALTQATFDHVLSLDADEYLSSKLLQSIRYAKLNWNACAYRMNRLSSYGGKWIKYGNWYPDRKIRLWDRRKGIWGGENPHDKVVLFGHPRIIQLQGDLMHIAYENATETLSKIQSYSTIYKNESVGKKNSSTLKILGHSIFSFLKSYLIKCGFLDGFEGLMVAAAEGNHVFFKYAKLYEANQQQLIGKNIIISRTDNLGDVILTLPIAGYLKRLIPDSKIYFIGKKYTKGIIEQSINVDVFLDQQEILNGTILLQSLKVKTILFVYPDYKLSKLAKKAGIVNRVSTSHRWFNWIYCNHLVNFSRVKSDLHESQLNFKLLKPFRFNTNVDLSEIPELYGINGGVKVESLLHPDKFNLIVHPKSKGSAKEWGLSNFSELINRLGEKNYHVFITGLKEEGEQMRNEMPSLFGGSHVTDLTGKLTLTELTSLTNSVDGLVAGSTGVLHLAAALGINALGLYSPMKPIHPGRWMPLGPFAHHLVLDKNCSACKYKDSCACLMAISVDQVMDCLLNMRDKKRILYSKLLAS